MLTLYTLPKKNFFFTLQTTISACHSITFLSDVDSHNCSEVSITLGFVYYNRCHYAARSVSSISMFIFLTAVVAFYLFKHFYAFYGIFIFSSNFKIYESGSIMMKLLLQ